jgi:uncharacterized membrane protein
VKVDPADAGGERPQIHVTTEQAVAGAETTVEVTVSNGGDDQLRDLRVQLASADGEMPVKTALEPVLAAENETTFRFDVTPPEAGEGTLEATLTYGGGERVTATEDVTIEPLRDDVSMYATVTEQYDRLVLQYRVTNHGNAPIEDVSVSGRSESGPLPMATVSTVEPKSTETVTVELNGRPTGTATLDAAYEVGDRTSTAEQSVALADATDDADDASTATATPTATNAVEDAGLVGSSPFLSGAVAGIVAITGLFVGYGRWRRNGPE